VQRAIRVQTGFVFERRQLGRLDPADVQEVQPSREGHLLVQFTLEGDDAVALQRIAEDQGERPGEVVRSLIRAASAKAA
jgi:hypothetical protein